MKDKREGKDKRLYNKNFAQAVNNALNGIVYCTTTQTNIRKQLVLGVIVMILSLFYDFTTGVFISSKTVGCVFESRLPCQVKRHHENVVPFHLAEVSR